MGLVVVMNIRRQWVLKRLSSSLLGGMWLSVGVGLAKRGERSGAGGKVLLPMMADINVAMLSMESEEILVVGSMS